MKYNRRNFLKTTSLSGMGLALAQVQPQTYQLLGVLNKNEQGTEPDIPFIPRRVASWWCTIEDLQWPQKSIRDKISRRAAAFAEAKIDTAINYGFHVRFDFSNYFGQLHGYYANVCEALHKYGIKFLDHYSCNHVERPRDKDELWRLHRNHRHHTLLFNDPQSAKYAQYEGHFFQDICEVDLRDGSRGYSPTYQFEIFCHNNPAFLEMHRKYLERLMREVPMDGIEVDDMCDYGGATTCGCRYCRERFKRDYGHEIPPHTDRNFWGDTTDDNTLLWGNYENPAFRDWIRMRAESVVDHVKMVKEVIGSRPLMTCCSSAGPVFLNMVALDLEKMAPHLDLFMLENVGLNVNCVHWTGMDAEAMLQKDIAEKRGKAPAMALSYSTYDAGGYLGWALSRFWGVANWSSTENQGLEEDPADAMTTEDIISPYNRWEAAHSDWDYREGKDLVEVRLVSNNYCRDNGWRNSEGAEHWDSCASWSQHLLQHNVGYRFVRAAELANATALLQSATPLVLDNVGCVSDDQFHALVIYLKKGGAAWLALPFGTHDERGNRRSVPLSDRLLQAKYRNLVLMESSTKSQPLQKLIAQGRFHPALVQTGGDRRWTARVRLYGDKPVIHFLNTAITAIPHATLRDTSGTFILKDIDSPVTDNKLRYTIDIRKVPLAGWVVMSPELRDRQVPVGITPARPGFSGIEADLSGIKTYAIMQVST